MNPQPKKVFHIGDMVRIKAGPFASFSGRIAGINQARHLLNVRVTIFRKTAAVKLGFGEVEKVEFTPPAGPESGLN